jgi:hypothetical protein
MNPKIGTWSREAALGRQLSLESGPFSAYERPLSGKADMQAGRMSAYHAKADIRLN